jgi:hypothetical protein
VTVLRGGQGETVASSSERVWAIDADQYAAGEGPCLEAARTSQIVRTGVAEGLERWPRFDQLSRQSQNTNVKLRDLATRLVENLPHRT